MFPGGIPARAKRLSASFSANGVCRWSLLRGTIHACQSGMTTSATASPPTIAQPHADFSGVAHGGCSSLTICVNDDKRRNAFEAVRAHDRSAHVHCGMPWQLAFLKNPQHILCWPRLHCHCQHGPVCRQSGDAVFFGAANGAPICPKVQSDGLTWMEGTPLMQRRFFCRAIGLHQGEHEIRSQAARNIPCLPGLN